MLRDCGNPGHPVPACRIPEGRGAQHPGSGAGGRRRERPMRVTVTRRGVASVLVTLLFLGCAAGPRPTGTAAGTGAAPTGARSAATDRPADPAVYLYIVRAHYHAEAGEWAEATRELRQIGRASG